MSIINADDYRPSQGLKELNTFLTEENKEKEESQYKIVKEVATDRIFEKLKKKEDQYEAEAKSKEPQFEIRKKIKKAKHEAGDGKNSSRKKEKEEDNEEYSDDSNEESKSDTSVEELITEEMFQKALQATLQKEMEKKNKKPKKSKIKIKKNVSMSRRLNSKNKLQKSTVRKLNETFKQSSTNELGLSESKRNVSVVHDATKYKPLQPALPRSMVHPPNIADRIRAAKRLHMTRRDMTEQKIIKNIAMHNDPADIQNFEVLYISNKNEKFLPEGFMRNSSQAFPPL